MCADHEIVEVRRDPDTQSESYILDYGRKTLLSALRLEERSTTDLSVDVDAKAIAQLVLAGATGNFLPVAQTFIEEQIKTELQHATSSSEEHSTVEHVSQRIYDWGDAQFLDQEVDWADGIGDAAAAAARPDDPDVAPAEPRTFKKLAGRKLIVRTRVIIKTYSGRYKLKGNYVLVKVDDAEQYVTIGVAVKITTPGIYFRPVALQYDDSKSEEENRAILNLHLAE